MPKKKKKNKLFITLIVLFGIYIALYSASMSGYYSYKEYDKMQLTKEAMEKFEKDVKNGKKIDAKDYIEEEKNYNNLLSKTSITFSNTIEKTFNTIINTLFNEIAKATA